MAKRIFVGKRFISSDSLLAGDETVIHGHGMGRVDLLLGNAVRLVVHL